MRDLAARLALSPLLVAQALAVRRRAQRLPEASGPREDTIGQGPPLRLRIIGDSSAAGVGAKTQEEALAGRTVALLSEHFEVSWVLDALTGATTASTLTRLETARPDPADLVITALGVNDVTRLVPPARWLARQQALQARIRSLYGPRRIYICGVPPLGAFPLLPNPLRWVLARQGAALEALMVAHAAATPGLTHMPFNLDPRPEYMASDGFHPSPLLYRLWGKEMASRIISDWPVLSA